MPTPKQLRSIVLCIALSTTAVSAETVFLKTGDTLEGTIQQMTSDQVTLSLPGGSTRKIPKSQISRIEFGSTRSAEKPSPSPPVTEPNFLSTLTKPESKYGTPAATFELWKTAAIAGDIDKMVDCYASFQQKEIRKQLKDLPKDAREKMRSTTARTQFTPAKPFYQGDRALLEITWQSGLQSDTQVLQFVLEKNHWKLIQ